MATLKTKWLRAIAVFSLLLGAFFVVKAMEKETKTTLAPMTVYFQPQSNDASEIQNPSNWDSEPQDVECDGFAYLCEVTFDTNTYADLDAFLLANPDKASIEENALAVSHKD